jgi:predicted metal-dependent enzyme (double-stranded beta helix superfamily)
MLTLDFPGSRKLIAAIDDAVGKDCDRALTDCLRNALCCLIRDDDVRLPDCVYHAGTDHYLRREIYTSEAHGYNVVAMTWGPGQGTPIHDHSGLWCVEGVWDGQLEITQYDLRERADDRCRFTAVGTLQAGAGSAGSLIPPHEYHSIRNPSDDAVAVSLHIYKRAMTCCSVFVPLGEEWYRRDMKSLALDSAA